MDDQELIKKLIDAIQGGKISRDQKKKADLAQEELRALQKKLPLTTKERKILVDQLKIAEELLKADKEKSKLIKDALEDQRKLNKANDDLVDILEKVGNSFVGLGKAAFRGEGSISSFTDNVLGLKTLGNRLDVNIETFRQLSQTGANFGESIIDLRQSAAEAALPLDDFASLVASNSQNLAALFGTTTIGAKRIAALGAETRRLGVDRLAPLGFTVDEINETLLLNLDSQRRTGVLNRLTDEQRINSAITFAEELDRLAKLTGAQRDELRAQIEQQQSNERFQAALQGQTEETRRRLQGFAGTVGNLAPNLNEGFQDLIANAGVPVTESALQLVQNIPQAQKIIQGLISGTLTSEQALGQLRDAASTSVDRFKQATVTGQVEFLRLQGDVINLGKRIVNVDGVFQELEDGPTDLVKNLTTFEQASKVLASQFQSIETGLLQGFGPALSGLVGGIQGIMGGTGGIANALSKAPYLTATILLGGLAGKYLFNKASQIGIIAAGTSIGTKGLGKTISSLMGSFGKGGAARSAGKFLGKAGLVGAGLSGAALAGGSENAGVNILGSAASGALAGSAFGLYGALAGGALGLGYGTFKALSGQRQFGGGMDMGKTYLTGERGPELVTPNVSSAVTSNNDLRNIFNTQELESKMNNMVTALNSTNQGISNMVNGVNTLVAVESRALKAVEKTARRDPSQVGLV